MASEATTMAVIDVAVFKYDVKFEPRPLRTFGGRHGLRGHQNG